MGQKNFKKYPLFDKNVFHDACGIGFVVTRSGRPEKRILPLALKALKQLAHRGAKSYDGKSGDGAGILVDLPKRFFNSVLKKDFGQKVPSGEVMAVAMVFTTARERKWIQEKFITLGKKSKLRLLGIRDVPTEKKALGEVALKIKPTVLQFIFSIKREKSKEIDTKLYLFRKTIEKDILDNKKKTYICSFSSKTIVYKGLMASAQLDQFYLDLAHDNFVVKMALFHERFSTNTGSTWDMAQPFQMVAHNGEINTIKGNRLWMESREGEISSKFWGSNLDKLRPIINCSGSDSQSFDNVLEFLVRSGRGVFDGMMMMIPDSYIEKTKYYKNRVMNKKMRDYFVYHENFMEPWDGPAALVFTDGDFVGAKMDRNGLRPLRYTITKDNLVIMASEAGIIEVEDKNLVLHHHMKSEEIFGVSLKDGTIIKNKELKIREASKKPYGELLKNNLRVLVRKEAKDEFGIFGLPKEGFDFKLRIAFGWSKEDLTKFLIPMATNSREPLGSMGDDTPLASISKIDRKFYDYFKQWFAQVTNPPIDSIRERSVMSLYKYLGSEDNLLSVAPTFHGAIRITSPVLSPREVLELYGYDDWFKHKKIICNYRKTGNLESKVKRIKKEAENALLNGAKIIFLTDEGLREGFLPIPMPLIVSSLHHYLVEKKMRSKVSIICITADACEDHHLAVLIALGASAVYPYMAYELIREHFDGDDWSVKMNNYRYALEKGLLKIMSKMGISTISSYCGSMLLHSIGLGPKISKFFFPSIPSNLGGIEIGFVKDILSKRHDLAYNQGEKGLLSEKGMFRYRKNGELHGYDPKTFRNIQNTASSKKLIKNINQDVVYIRDFLKVKAKRSSIDINLVESTDSILKRFGSGGISFGAISAVSHRELARGFAMAGSKSNTGEGGELEDRYSISNPDKYVNSYTKQIASGRFGVNVEYLAAASEIQIKMAQGAKPGEGGQLPGFKVTHLIASARSATPGMPLISPPPHHDIYSIEDIKQLIHDLKVVNPRAKVSVKLVSQPGIGVIASGVVKAGADIVLVSGSDGGTGASPLGSLKHTGFPWEYGLAETHQVLNANGLRDRVILRVDGGIKWAKDIIIAAIFGAEEFDFGTSALVALGCVMARQCHLNTCPAGIATNDDKYMKKFRGKAENVTNYLKEIADEVRSELSKIGYTQIHHVIGRTDLLRINDLQREFYKNRNIDLDLILNKNNKMGLPLEYDVKINYTDARKKKSIDEQVLEEIRSEILTHGHAVIYKNIANTDRSIGARISGEISFLFGKNNFKGSVQCRLFGTAGQSFGAFLGKGVELRLKGIANDYVGKGMASGLITIRMPNKIRRQDKDHTVIGNVALYGATGGEIFIAGKGGERFAVRNSGASGVIEGIGNHGCEYMTQGTIVVLGEIGKNFGAGMTGGIAFVYSKMKKLNNYINKDFVKESDLALKDQNLVIRLIRNHVFHTDSSIGKKIINSWEQEIKHFKKLTPKALDIIDLEDIYSLHVSDRMNVILNE
tara:strand:+ start:64272 stop:68768 length:4497 start_codon:yes stop_codon:yes gene_type:complete